MNSTVSRSGRIITPPLRSWIGERKSVDLNGTMVIVAESEDTTGSSCMKPCVKMQKNEKKNIRRPTPKVIYVEETVKTVVEYKYKPSLGPSAVEPPLKEIQPSNLASELAEVDNRDIQDSGIGSFKSFRQPGMGSSSELESQAEEATRKSAKKSKRKRIMIPSSLRKRASKRSSSQSKSVSKTQSVQSKSSDEAPAIEISSVGGNGKERSLILEVISPIRSSADFSNYLPSPLLPVPELKNRFEKVLANNYAKQRTNALHTYSTTDDPSPVKARKTKTTAPKKLTKKVPVAKKEAKSTKQVQDEIENSTNKINTQGKDKGSDIIVEKDVPKQVAPAVVVAPKPILKAFQQPVMAPFNVQQSEEEFSSDESAASGEDEDFMFLGCTPLPAKYKRKTKIAKAPKLLSESNDHVSYLSDMSQNVTWQPKVIKKQKEEDKKREELKRELEQAKAKVEKVVQKKPKAEKPKKDKVTKPTKVATKRKPTSKEKPMKKKSSPKPATPAELAGKKEKKPRSKKVGTVGTGKQSEGLKEPKKKVTSKKKTDKEQTLNLSEISLAESNKKQRKRKSPEVQNEAVKKLKTVKGKQDFMRGLLDYAKVPQGACNDAFEDMGLPIRPVFSERFIDDHFSDRSTDGEVSGMSCLSAVTPPMRHSINENVSDVVTPRRVNPDDSLADYRHLRMINNHIDAHGKDNRRKGKKKPPPSNITLDDTLKARSLTPVEVRINNSAYTPTVARKRIPAAGTPAKVKVMLNFLDKKDMFACNDSEDSGDESGAAEGALADYLDDLRQAEKKPKKFVKQKLMTRKVR